ncbi:MAG: biopolymer transporter ExbD [Campylobacterales bacterium]|nr:biopolymer transporter ExbD [Campylobacterales bacterium]
MRSLKRQDSMNVIPFIDVLLVLLAIVFVISNFIALGKIDINLPQASTVEEIENVKRTITINEQKEFFLDDAPISREELMAKIETFSKEDVVTIMSDKQAYYEDFIYVIDILKQNSIDKISMVVKK